MRSCKSFGHCSAQKYWKFIFKCTFGQEWKRLGKVRCTWPSEYNTAVR